jgi:hypothetical protein
VTRDRYEAAIQKQKAEAAKVLLDETNKVRDLERRVGLLNNHIEVEHARRDKELQDERRRLERLARERGGLRDPGRGGAGRDCSPGGDRPTSGGGAGAASGAELSAEASGFLHQLAAEADAVVAQYLTCQGYVVKLHQELAARR